jgi:superoxide reductase
MNIIKKSIDEFNELRSPKATAELISSKNTFFEIKFTGSFCKTCGFYDYFDDLRIVLEEKGLKTKIGKIKEIEEGAIVKFVKSRIITK